VRCSWSEHVEVAQRLGATAPDELGTALALMGAALLMAAQDLLVQDSALMVHCE